MSSNSNESQPQDAPAAHHEPLLLPPPEEGPATNLELGQTLKLDKLGPMVVNSDGTVSRIANWDNMSDLEKERTYRILVKRNQIRIADFKSKEESTPPTEQS